MIVDRPWFVRAVIGLTIALAGLWLAMLAWSVPHLTAITGGAAIFDQRVSGYTIEEARIVLGLLGDEGARYYLDVQQKLDSVFPLLQVLVVSGWLLVVGRALKREGVDGLMTPTLLGVLAAMIGAIADYGENGAVRLMLMGGMNGLDPDLVRRASGMTQLKFGAGILSALVLAGLLVFRLARQRKTG